MTEERLADLFRCAGYDVQQAANRFWFRASRHIYQALPVIAHSAPAGDELGPLFKNRQLYGAQCASLNGPGIPCAAHVVTDPDYGLGSLQRQFRQHVRRGLNNCELRDIAFDELHQRGPQVNQDAAQRRDYMAPHFVNPDLWKRFCDAAESIEGCGVLASFVGSRLAAYIVHFQIGDQVIALYVVCDGRMNKHSPNHCLYYEFARRMIVRDDVGSVALGLQSFSGRTSIDRFKAHAGFELQPCFQSAVLRPAARHLLQNRLTRSCVEAIYRATNGRQLQRIRQVILEADASS